MEEYKYGRLKRMTMAARVGGALVAAGLTISPAAAQPQKINDKAAVEILPDGTKIGVTDKVVIVVQPNGDKVSCERDGSGGIMQTQVGGQMWTVPHLDGGTVILTNLDNEGSPLNGEKIVVKAPNGLPLTSGSAAVFKADINTNKVEEITGTPRAGKAQRRADMMTKGCLDIIRANHLAPQ